MIKLFTAILLFVSLTMNFGVYAQKNSSKSEKTKNIGLLLGGSDACYNAAANVFEALAHQEGWLISRSSSDYDKKLESRNIDEFIAKKVDAVVMSTIDITLGCENAKKCNDAAIPIFFVITAPDLSCGGKPTGVVTADWYQIGYMNGALIAKRYPQARCVLIEGGYDQGITEMMREGFLEGLKSIKEAKAQVVANVSGSWMKPNAMAALEDLFQSGIEFDVIFTGNEEMMSGVVEMLSTKNLLDKYHLFSENGREDIGIKYIKDGIIEATVGASTSAEGDLAFQLVKEFFITGKIPGQIYNKLTLITKENINKAIPWDAQDYLSKKKAGNLVVDYRKMEIVKKPRSWSKEGNNYKSVTFHK